mgnify:CR=1 FL=1
MRFVRGHQKDKNEKRDYLNRRPAFIDFLKKKIELFT